MAVAGRHLVTAFAASRSSAASKERLGLSALATLMPIVASIGGNTGNQTMAIMIRALAVDQVKPSGAWRVLNKELLVSLLNGAGRRRRSRRAGAVFEPCSAW